MKLTKYEHACVVLEEQGQKIVIDPGMFSALPEDLVAVAVVITHDHTDHLAEENIRQLQGSNKELKIYASKEAASKLSTAVVPDVGMKYEAGPFTLEFFGGLHAQIHPDYPVPGNLGIMINGLIYYPGDSFALPDVPVEVLLVPAAAPWMKTAEAMSFIAAVKPKLAIPTHDAVLSEAGTSFADGWLKQAADKAGSSYRRLSTGESLEI